MLKIHPPPPTKNFEELFDMQRYRFSSLSEALDYGQRVARQFGFKLRVATTNLCQREQLVHKCMFFISLIALTVVFKIDYIHLSYFLIIQTFAAHVKDGLVRKKQRHGKQQQQRVSEPTPLSWPHSTADPTASARSARRTTTERRAAGATGSVV
jgi:hypothetical protein